MRDSERIEDTIFRLSDGERGHPVWIRLKAQLQVMLDRERRNNDKDKDPVETANVRGRIKMLKEIIKFGDDPPPAIDG